MSPACVKSGQDTLVSLPLLSTHRHVNDSCLMPLYCVRITYSVSFCIVTGTGFFALFSSFGLLSFFVCVLIACMPPNTKMLSSIIIISRLLNFIIFYPVLLKNITILYVVFYILLIFFGERLCCLCV